MIEGMPLPPNFFGAPGAARDTIPGVAAVPSDCLPLADHVRLSDVEPGLSAPPAASAAQRCG